MEEESISAASCGAFDVQKCQVDDVIRVFDEGVKGVKSGIRTVDLEKAGIDLKMYDVDAQWLMMVVGNCGMMGRKIGC